MFDRIKTAMNRLLLALLVCASAFAQIVTPNGDIHYWGGCYGGTKQKCDQEYIAWAKGLTQAPTAKPKPAHPLAGIVHPHAIPLPGNDACAGFDLTTGDYRGDMPCQPPPKEIPFCGYSAPGEDCVKLPDGYQLMPKNKKTAKVPCEPQFGVVYTYDPCPSTGLMPKETK